MNHLGTMNHLGKLGHMNHLGHDSPPFGKPPQPSPLLAAIAAATVLALGMGVGRFAFTGLMPMLLREGGLTLQVASWSAAANYAGYVLGALALTRSPPQHARSLCLLAMLGTAAGVLAMLAWRQGGALIALRAGLGLCSAMAMVGASQWLLQCLGQSHRAATMYSGVGAGVWACAQLLVYLEQRHANASLAMCWLGLLALLAGVAAASGLRTPANTTRTSTLAQVRAGLPAFGQSSLSTSTARPARKAAARLLLAYGLSGLGTISTATYLPLIVLGQGGSTGVSAGLNSGTAATLQVWALFGLAALPSCHLWQALERHWGTQVALRLNCLLQALGVALPALWPSAASGWASACLVGGSFMGTVTIAMPAARVLAENLRVNLLAPMTAAYGLGQVLGPLLAQGWQASQARLAPHLVMLWPALQGSAALQSPFGVPLLGGACALAGAVLLAPQLDEFSMRKK